MKKRRKLRPIGDILMDLEPLLQELTCGNDQHLGHDMQAGDVLSQIFGYYERHVPDCIEEYTDGTKPILYGHKDVVLKEKK
jgi:hypothetical protein